MMSYALMLLAGCHEYALYGIPPEPDEVSFAPRAEEDLPADDNAWDDVIHSTVEEDDSTEISAPDVVIPDASMDVERPKDLEECVPGYEAEYFALPASHPDIVDAEEGLRPGDHPLSHDWFDARYLSQTQVDPSLMFGEDWWPLDVGGAEDPAPFAVHWRGWVALSEAQLLTMYLGSDDDAWVLIDDVMVADQGGVHLLEDRSYTTALDAGLHRIDIYTAERLGPASAMWHEWEEPITVMACPSL
jgi:hypothetical protein